MSSPSQNASSLRSIFKFAGSKRGGVLVEFNYRKPVLSAVALAHVASPHTSLPLDNALARVKTLLVRVILQRCRGCG